jgi:hypothetical protein
MTRRDIHPLVFGVIDVFDQDHELYVLSIEKNFGHSAALSV